MIKAILIDRDQSIKIHVIKFRSPRILNKEFIENNTEHRINGGKVIFKEYQLFSICGLSLFENGEHHDAAIYMEI